MGQKINPNVFQIEKTNDWQSKYFEKKNTEYSIYSKKDVEIRNFINKFFKNQRLVLHHCKLYYLNESLHIFISYHQNHPKNLNRNFYLNNRKNYKMNQIEKTMKKNKNVEKLFINNRTIKKNRGITKLFNYKKATEKATIQRIKKLFNYKKNIGINKAIKKKKNRSIKNKKLFNYKKFYKIRKIKKKFRFKKKKCLYKRKKLRYKKTVLEKNFKKSKYLTKKPKLLKKQYLLQTKNIEKRLRTTFFLENFFESLTSFTNEKTKIFLVLQHANNDLKQKIFKRTREDLKKKLTSLRRYQREDYFEEGIDILFTCLTHTKSSKLLAKFITFYLNKLKKQQHRFLNFIKHTLTLLKKRISSKCKGIKIEVKGRITKATRAKNRVIRVAKNVPLFSIDSNVNYSEETAFATNGTIGVKVWIYEF